MDFTPATGQGQLAIECRADDSLPIDDTVLYAIDRRLAVVERFFAELNFGCHTPAAVWARVNGRQIAVIDVLKPDGSESLKIEVPVPLAGGEEDLQLAMRRLRSGIRAFTALVGADTATA